MLVNVYCPVCGIRLRPTPRPGPDGAGIPRHVLFDGGSCPGSGFTIFCSPYLHETDPGTGRKVGAPS